MDLSIFVSRRFPRSPNSINFTHTAPNADEPSFSISREPDFGYPIIEGMALSLKCEIEANPPSRAKWIKDGDVNQSMYKSRQPPLPDTSPEGALNISRCTVKNSGWYRCVTDHEFGHFSSFSLYLNIRSTFSALKFNTEYFSTERTNNQMQNTIETMKSRLDTMKSPFSRSSASNSRTALLYTPSILLCIITLLVGVLNSPTMAEFSTKDSSL